MSCLQSSSIDTSHCSDSVLTPYCFSTSSASSSNAWYCLAAKTIVAPREANSMAQALPIPEEAPVMITTLSLKFFKMDYGINDKSMLCFFHRSEEHTSELQSREKL